MIMTECLECLAGHSVIESMLPIAPTVLDVGCRDFQFTRAILALRPQARIIALDPDPAIEDPCIDGCTFVKAALVGDERESVRYAAFSTGEGNYLTTESGPPDSEMLDVPCTNIRKAMERFSVEHWDLVKLDCESSEFDILWNWPGPIASQISVEFHDYTDPVKYDDRYFADLFARLPWYRVIQHELYKVGYSFGHWDSVLARA